MADGSTLQAFELDGVKYLSGLYALDSKSMGEAKDEAVQCWIHIASLGEYKGHPSGGFAFTERAFAQIMSNFDARTTPLNVDYEHQTFNRALKGPIDSAGWIVQLELRADGDELWALTELLPEAADRVRGKQLRHCSPVIIPEATDKKTADDIGFELRSLALTNDPFLDGLHPIQLTRIAAMTDAEKKAEEDAAKDKDAKDSEAKKLAEPAAEGGSAAEAFINALADASGSDADMVIAYLQENQDMLVKAIQDGMEKGGTPAENKDRQMRAMTITVGPVKTVKSDDKALEIAMNHKDSQIRKLTEELATVKSTVDGFVAAKVAAEVAALHAKVKSLQTAGFVGKEQQAFDDAVKLFTFDPALAERTYSMATPPVGLVAGETDPVAESGNGNKPLLMSQLTDGQSAAFAMLKGMGRTEKQALEFIAKDAAERTSN